MLLIPNAKESTPHVDVPFHRKVYASLWQGAGAKELQETASS